MRPDMMNMYTEFRFSMSICGEGLDIIDFAGGAREPFCHALSCKPQNKTFLAGSGLRAKFGDFGACLG